MSPKYEGRMVSIASPHVLILTNEHPDRSRLTADRWVMFEAGVDIPRDRAVDRNFQPQSLAQMRQQCDEEREEREEEELLAAAGDMSRAYGAQEKVGSVKKAIRGCFLKLSWD